MGHPPPRQRTRYGRLVPAACHRRDIRWLFARCSEHADNPPFRRPRHRLCNRRRRSRRPNRRRNRNDLPGLQIRNRQRKPANQRQLQTPIKWQCRIKNLHPRSFGSTQLWRPMGPAHRPRAHWKTPHDTITTPTMGIQFVVTTTTKRQQPQQPQQRRLRNHHHRHRRSPAPHATATPRQTSHHRSKPRRRLGQQYLRRRVSSIFHCWENPPRSTA